MATGSRCGAEITIMMVLLLLLLLPLLLLLQLLPLLLLLPTTTTTTAITTTTTSAADTTPTPTPTTNTNTNTTTSSDKNKHDMQSRNVCCRAKTPTSCARVRASLVLSPIFIVVRNAVTRADVRDVLMRRDVSTSFNHQYSVKIPQVLSCPSGAWPNSSIQAL